MAIGIAAIVAVLAAEESWQGAMEREYERLGGKVISIELPTSVTDLKRCRLQLDDAEAIRRECPDVESVGVLLGPIPLAVKSGRNHATLNGYQFSPEFLSIRGWEVTRTAGRTRLPPTGCLLSPFSAEMLFGRNHRNLLPSELRIQGRRTPLNGIVAVPTEIDDAGEGYLLLPLGKNYERFAARWVWIVAASGRLQRAVNQIDALLSKRLGAKTPSRFAGGAWRMVADATAARSRLRLFTGMALVCILAVAILGVASTLLVNMEERVREIALRRSLGAQATHIATEVVAESALMCSIGGVAGCALAYALLQTVGTWLFRGESLPFVSRSLGMATSPPAGFVARLPWQAVLVGITACLGAAFFAGAVPALTAAALQPSEALSITPPRRHWVGRLLATAQLAFGVCAAAILLALYAGIGRQSISNFSHFSRADTVDMRRFYQPDRRGNLKSDMALWRAYLKLWESRASIGLLAKRCSAVSAARRIWRAGDLHAKRASATADLRALIAVDEGIGNETRADPVTLASGRAIRLSDSRAGLRVCVIGQEIKEKLFGSRPALGQEIRIAGVPFSVVGVAAHYAWRFQRDPGREIVLTPDCDIIVPIAALPRAWLLSRGNPTIVFELTDPRMADAAQAQITAQTRRILNLPEGVMPFLANRAATAARLLRMGRDLSLRATLIGSSGLWIALVGLVNVLSASFHARVREIGLLRALGATRWTIKIHGAAEGLVISLVGALVGVCVAAAVAALLGKLTEVPVHIPASWATVVVMASAFAGGIASLLPAAQAAAVDPAVALRQE
jgi:putative ABC transport system permease protein